jgi:DNA-binding transcriptional ArsR family regulator
MTNAARLAETASLIGDPTRAALLTALMGGQALTAGELTRLCGVAPSTMSGHLAKLAEAGLVAGLALGRRRYFRLATPEAAALLEGLMVFAGRDRPRPRAPSRVPPALQAARSCYDHLAGRLGVALADALAARGAVVLSDGSGEVTEAGAAWLAEFGVEPAPGRRALCRPCLDWSERRPHIAGRLGAGLMQRALELGWVEHGAEPRALRVTPRGRRGFSDRFGLDVQ